MQQETELNLKRVIKKNRVPKTQFPWATRYCWRQSDFHFKVVCRPTWRQHEFHVHIWYILRSWTGSHWSINSVHSLTMLMTMVIVNEHNAITKAHKCASGLGCHGFRVWSVGSLVPSHIWTYTVFCGNRTLGNKNQWFLNLNTTIFIQE